MGEIRIFKQKSILVFILLIFTASLVIRLYKLGEIPPGLNTDEASQGYNAYSLLLTGKDRYGQPFPILFRSFGMYQAPLYTYLSVIPIYLFGLSIVSIRLVSIVSGLLIVVITYLILNKITHDRPLALTSAAVVGMAPWSVMFSRMATEANLGLLFFLSAVYLFILSREKHYIFLIACFVLGLSTHAYYSERITSIIFLVTFSFIFRKEFFNNKYWKYTISGVAIFGITQIPHFFMLASGALISRLDQTRFAEPTYCYQNIGWISYTPIIKLLCRLREFLSLYIVYFSPKNLFFDPDPQPWRSVPNLSVFYSWMVIPFIFGLTHLIKKWKTELSRILIVFIVVSPIPAAFTRDPFYTLRVLLFLWAVSIVISLGIKYLVYQLFGTSRKLLLLFMFTISMISFYNSYFILGKYERGETWGYSNIKLIFKTETFKDTKFVVDSARDIAAGLRFAFFKKYDPLKLHEVLKSQVSGSYYSNTEISEDYYTIDNVEIRPINWISDLCKKQILVGDMLAISNDQVKEHKLNLQFTIDSIRKEPYLFGYMTAQDTTCTKFK